MTDQNLTPDQRLLLGAVLETEQNLGTGPTIDIDEQGNVKEPEADPGNPGEENKVILSLLIAMLTPAMPFLAQCYPPDVIERIALAYTAVEEKYGWNVRGMMGVEVQLAIVALPPTIQAIVLGRLYFEEKKRQANEKDITPRPGEDADGSH